MKNSVHDDQHDNKDWDYQLQDWNVLTKKFKKRYYSHYETNFNCKFLVSEACTQLWEKMVRANS